MFRSRLFRVGSLIAAVGAIFFATLFLFPKDPSRSFLNKPPSGWSHLRGYFAGAGWARADLAEDRAFILVAGMADESLDRETGLRTWGLGCVVDPGGEGVADGYNRVVRLYVRLKGSPPNSRKRWENILYNLNEYFDRKAQNDPPASFVVDGPPILAPDGRTEVLLRSRPQTYDTAYLIKWKPDVRHSAWSVLPKDGLVEFSTWPLMPRDGLLSYYPGPPGSDLLLLRGTAGRTKAEATAAFDLRYGFWLRFEERNKRDQ